VRSSAKCAAATFTSSRNWAATVSGELSTSRPRYQNYADFSAQYKLTEGLVITIEPIIAAGTGDISLDNDGWTYRTADGSLSAHYEHTIVITRGEPVLLTAA